LLFNHNTIKLDITSFEKSETKKLVWKHSSFCLDQTVHGGDQEARLPYKKHTFEGTIAVRRFGGG
jgi:hypothetical protein